MNPKEHKMEFATLMFMLLCCFDGVCFGVIGLGIGLIFLGVAQAFGLGFLAFGLGVVYAARFGARRIVRAIADGWDKAEQEAAHEV